MVPQELPVYATDYKQDVFLSSVTSATPEVVSMIRPVWILPPIITGALGHWQAADAAVIDRKYVLFNLTWLFKGDYQRRKGTRFSE
ncbi:hypothetical protein TcasGA2_TC016277 [Tribolium castaneum]|uniref:Uncharacterized protein n=1 Tax=Tribolium castaneum TaxID=7070 RepID=D6X2U8_TRICA|nr:hypothetical protein TcasGA2_TC016277 [Tribolium castaneum]